VTRVSSVEDGARALNLAQHLRHWRQKANLSMAGLAAAGGPSKPVQVRLEKGDGPEPSGDTLDSIDLGLGMPFGTARRALSGEYLMDVEPRPGKVVVVDQMATYLPGYADLLTQNVFEDLAYIVSRIQLPRAKRIALERILEEPGRLEVALAPHAGNPDVAHRLNLIYQNGIGQVRALLEHSEKPEEQESSNKGVQ